MAPAADEETEKEATQREAEHEERMAEYRTEQERKEEERQAECERRQKEYEAEQGRREEQRKARVATFDRLLEQAPPLFTAAQFRLFLRLVVYVDPNSFLEEVTRAYSLPFPTMRFVGRFHISENRVSEAAAIEGSAS